MAFNDETRETARATGLGIIERLNAHWSIDLGAIIFNESLPHDERRHRCVMAMLEPALEAIDRLHLDLGLDPDPVDNADLLARVAAKDISLEPNLVINDHNFKLVRDYKGAKISEYVFNLAKRMEQMSKAQTPGELAAEIIGGGLASVGVSMAWNLIGFLNEGKIFTDAVKAAVKGLGTKTVVTIIIIALAALLLYLLLTNPKKILGIVINDTDNDIVVENWRLGTQGGDRKGSDLYMAHGEVASFPVDHKTQNLDSPEIQVHARSVGETEEDTIRYMGVYFCDRNIGLRGAEGLFLFSGLDGGNKIAHMFAVPYTHDNGTYMDPIARTPSDKEAYFRELYNKRSVNCERSIAGYNLISRVNSGRGGVVGLIASISKW